MQVFYIFLLISLAVGQLIRIPLGPGIALYLHDIVLGIAVFLFGASLITHKLRVLPKLTKPILLFVLAGVVSLLANSFAFSANALALSSLYLSRWMFYAFVYVLLAQKQVSPMVLLKQLFYFGFAFGVIGIFQFILYPNLRFLLYLGWDPHYYRLFSTVFDPNFAGILLVFSVFLGYFLFRVSKNRTYVIAVGILMIALYLTYSRSSYLALIMGVFTYGIFEKKWKLLLSIISLCIGVILVIPRPGGDTLRLWREDSTYSRFSNWKESIQMFARAPVFGHGFNTLRYIQTPVVLPASNYVSHAGAGVDSSLLFLLVTSGVVGCGAYLYVFYRAGTFRAKNSKAKQLHSLYVSSISALFVHSLFVNSMFYPWVMIWVWIIVATMELTSDI